MPSHAQPGEALVEIGPGRGALTARLLEARRRARCGRDRPRPCRRAATLARRAPGFALHEADALEFDFAALAAQRGQRLRVVGNLPYNISTPLLFHLLRTPAAIADLHVMLQREVVERMAAGPGQRRLWPADGDARALGRRSSSLFDVGPGSSARRRRVWSAVARLTVRREPRFPVDARFGKLVARPSPSAARRCATPSGHCSTRQRSRPRASIPAPAPKR